MLRLEDFAWVLAVVLCMRSVRALCPMRCTCDDASLRVQCDSAQLDVVPITLNPGLRQLHLSHNHIKGIMASFSVYRNLDFLDVSHNQLVTLSGGNFEELRQLKILLLNSNMISTLTNSTFRGLSSLTVLQLNENYIEDISGGVFSPLVKLEKLDLSQNRITSIDNQALSSLSNLKTLLLRDNKFSAIPSSVFQHVPGLLKLDLGLNSFYEIPENSFSSLTNLEELVLDGCGIRLIQAGGFTGLGALLKLQLQDNDLLDIPTRQLFDLLRLEELNIGQNTFRELRALAFQRLQYLRTLEINGAQHFEKIARGAFADNNNLERVIFNHNKILGEIESGAFDGLSNLKHVSLRGNAFITLSPSVLAWDELEFADVRDNPLVCNCSIVWLWRLLHGKNYTTSSSSMDFRQVMCASPSRLKDRTLLELSIGQLDCFNLDIRRQVLIGIVAGAILITGVMVMLGFRYRGKVAGVLKNKWGGGRKEPHYKKTQAGVEDDSNILQNSIHQHKVTPVTEL